MAALRFILLAILVGTFTPPLGAKQSTPSNEPSIDWNYALLRGTWSTHTFEMKWTLNFVSDKDLVFNGRQLTYMLVGDRLRVSGRSGTNEYIYSVDRSLKIRFPSGQWREFDRVSDGDQESLVDGSFYLLSTMLSDSATNLDPASIYFRNHREFLDEAGNYTSADDSLNSEENDSTIPPCTGPVLYRVEGNRILLSCKEGPAGELSIHSRDMDGNVTSVLYRGEIFHAPPQPVTVIPSAWPVYYPGPAPPPPPPHPGPPPLPPRPDPRPPTPPITCPPKPPVFPEKRDFGTTRGDANTAKDSGQRTSGTRR